MLGRYIAPSMLWALHCPRQAPDATLRISLGVTTPKATQRKPPAPLVAMVRDGSEHSPRHAHRHWCPQAQDLLIMAMSGRYVARHARALRCPFRRDRRSSTAMSGRYLARDTPGRYLALFLPAQPPGATRVSTAAPPGATRVSTTAAKTRSTTASGSHPGIDSGYSGSHPGIDSGCEDAVDDCLREPPGYRRRLPLAHT